MIFERTPLEGVWVVGLDRKADARGFFARAFCQEEFRAHGLEPEVVQANLGHNARAGTIRGVHFQFPPHAETKFVRAVRGAVLDVAVDLRPESPTFLHHVAVELSADNGRALYVPRRFGHAYQVLADGTDVLYFASAPWAPGADGGLSPFDPALGIAWPLPVTEISQKDRDWRAWAEAGPELRRRMQA